VKTNKEGQSNRVKNGRDVQREIHLALGFVVDKFNDEFSLEGETVFIYDTPYGKLTTTPDHLIRIASTGECVVAAGTKASLKDRRTQDYHNARVFKDGNSSVRWYEFTRSYNPDLWDTEKIKARCLKDLAEGGTLWNGIASTRWPESMKNLLAEIESFLRSISKNRRQ
jgi:hypothetical protein